MAKTENILIFKKSYQLTQEILQATSLFPKSQRFLMAARLEETAIKILEYITQANTLETLSKLPRTVSSLQARQCLYVEHDSVPAISSSSIISIHSKRLRSL